MDQNQKTTLYVIIGIVICCCCLLLSGVAGYFIYNRTAGAGAGAGASSTTTLQKPLSSQKITTVNEYGCPPQNFIRTSPNSSNEPTWAGDGAGDAMRYLVFDSAQNKLYCCRDPNKCNFEKGGWFYGWDINDARLNYQ